MPTVNVEMMQQLLQEFTEKEALTGEEIKVIEQQVQELETRITTCRDRLQNLNEDKDRLAVMMNRYVGNNNTSPPSQVRSEASSRPPKLADSFKAAAAENLSGSASLAPADASTKNSVIEDLESVPSEHSSESQGEDKHAGGDDAIKSINDALKGLFRK